MCSWECLPHLVLVISQPPVDISGCFVGRMEKILFLFITDISERLNWTELNGYIWRRKWQPTPVFLPGKFHGGLQSTVSKSQPRLSNWAHYWCIVDFQCCINFCCTAKWLSYTHVYILFNIPLHYGLSQGIGWNPLCSAVGPCCVSILYNSLRLLTPNS